MDDHYSNHYQNINPNMMQKESGIYAGNGNAAIIVFPNKLNPVMQKESQTATETPKYSIEKKLNEMPGTKRTNVYKLCLHLDIHINTLYKWMAVKKGEKSSIPVDTFYEIANFLSCTPNDLYNV